jgi:hypothetical protein
MSSGARIMRSDHGTRDCVAPKRGFGNLVTLASQCSRTGLSCFVPAGLREKSPRPTTENTSWHLGLPVGVSCQDLHRGHRGTEVTEKRNAPGLASESDATPGLQNAGAEETARGRVFPPVANYAKGGAPAKARSWWIRQTCSKVQ